MGHNIRRIRKEKGIKQTELAALLQLENVVMTREALVKIERGKHELHMGPYGLRRCDRTRILQGRPPVL